MKVARKPASGSKKVSVSPTLDFERGAGFPHFKVIGVDEVGRGCLAGPVVAAAVRLPPEWDLSLGKLRQRHPEIRSITDSKAMTAKKRTEIAPWIRANVAAFGIAHATVEEIDRINIYHASHLAMKRAADEIGKFHHVLVDGNVVPKYFHAMDCKSTPIIKGDLHSLSIACASIIAKVFRDDWMGELATAHPGYGLEVHKGYGTAMHLAALRNIGASAIHRRTFGPVREVLGLPPLPEVRRKAEAAGESLERDLNSPFQGDFF
jgi:ribonuclease HII